MKSYWNHIKDTADQIGADIDAEAAWDRFEQRRDKGKDRAFIWWSIGVVGLLLLFGGAFYFMPNSEADINNSSADIVITNHPEAESIVSQTASKKNTGNIKTRQDLINAEIKSNNLDSEFAYSNNAGKRPAYIVNEKEKIKSLQNENSYSSQPNLNGVMNTHHGSKKEASDTHEEDTGIAKNIKNYENTYRTTTEYTNDAAPALKIDPTEEDVIADFEIKKLDDYHNSPTNRTAEDGQVNQIDHNHEIAPDRSSSIVPVDETVDRKLITIPAIPIMNSLTWKKAVLLVEEYIPFSEGLSGKQKVIDNSLEFQIRYIYGIVDRTFKGDNRLIERRVNQEELKESNAIEFLLTKKISSIISFSSGLSIDQYRSRLLEVDQDLIQNVVFSDVLLELRTRNGVPQELRGEFIGSQTIITERVRYQKYIDVSIPLYVNLNLSILRRVSLSLSTGVSYSPLNATKGVTFESGESVGMYQELSQLDYRKSGMIQGLADMSVLINVRPDLNFKIGGQLRQDLNNRFMSSENISEKLNSYGVLLGIQKHF